MVVGINVGFMLIVGFCDGNKEGYCDGDASGLEDGIFEGCCEGICVVVGCILG